ncbi:hypothetical protein GQ55_5G156900 [Panicum hallii var. hallii]|uniref:Uncharacterized protein n=1 Tax=Panicum hallii var. hallii TaxID=1504633 RepID=A0A2T7DGR5_9POAL|nr:hypothetical protein GQ55_5G156900 [Panicum hallii var. hallii]
MGAASSELSHSDRNFLIRPFVWPPSLQQPASPWRWPRSPRRRGEVEQRLGAPHAERGAVVRRGGLLGRAECAEPEPRAVPRRVADLRGVLAPRPPPHPAVVPPRARRLWCVRGCGAAVVVATAAAALPRGARSERHQRRRRPQRRRGRERRAGGGRSGAAAGRLAEHVEEDHVQGVVLVEGEVLAVPVPVRRRGAGHQGEGRVHARDHARVRGTGTAAGGRPGRGDAAAAAALQGERHVRVHVPRTPVLCSRGLAWPGHETTHTRVPG